MDSVRASRLFSCSKACGVSGCAFICLSLAVSAVGIISIVNSVELHNTLLQLTVTTCNITGTAIIREKSPCVDMRPRISLRAWRAFQHDCYAAQWHVEYEVGEGLAQNKVTGTIAGIFQPTREMAELEITRSSHHVGYENPCMYDVNEDVVAYWEAHDIIADEAAWRGLAFICSAISVGSVTMAMLWLWTSVVLRRRAIGVARSTLQTSVDNHVGIVTTAAHAQPDASRQYDSSLRSHSTAGAMGEEATEDLTTELGPAVELRFQRRTGNDSARLEDHLLPV
eukprot:SAG31_NODE_3577_length_4103_cov_2.362637_7_plen_282_part_00